MLTFPKGRLSLEYRHPGGCRTMARSGHFLVSSRGPAGRLAAGRARRSQKFPMLRLGSGWRRLRGCWRLGDEVRHAETEFTADSVRKVLFHPSGQPQREGGEDDLVEGVALEGGAHGLDWVGVPNFPVDLSPQLVEE